jgi:N-acetylmuramic acid 6-phosphate etherase
VSIRVLVGPEVITGSTRMKAGTATKLVLNTLTTAAMVKLGKVHGNLMVDLRAVNNKLRDRSVRIVMELTRLSRGKAQALLRRAEGKVKPAVVMHWRKVDLAAALRILDECDHSLRRAMEDVGAEIRSTKSGNSKFQTARAARRQRFGP